MVVWHQVHSRSGISGEDAVWVEAGLDVVMIEDISAEKRMKSTMSRYIDPSIADRLLADKSDIFQRAGIETNDRGELTRRLSHLARYRELVDEIAKLVVVI